MVKPIHYGRLEMLAWSPGHPSMTVFLKKKKNDSQMEIKNSMNHSPCARHGAIGAGFCYFPT
jgi:hypothetical protein